MIVLPEEAFSHTNSENIHVTIILLPILDLGLYHLKSKTLTPFVDLKNSLTDLHQTCDF